MLIEGPQKDCVCVCYVHTLIKGIYFSDIVMKSLMVIKKCFVLTAMVNVCTCEYVCELCVNVCLGVLH